MKKTLKTMRVMAALFLLVVTTSSHSQGAKDPLERMTASGQVRSYLMVSSHIPREDLVGLAQSAAVAGIPLVFNGVMNDANAKTLDLSATQAWVMNLKSECCANSNLTTFIDPPLFTQFKVTSVPVLVIARGDEFTKIAGVAPLSEALKQVAQRSKIAWAKGAAEKHYLKMRTTTE